MIWSIHVHPFGIGWKTSLLGSAKWLQPDSRYSRVRESELWQLRFAKWASCATQCECVWLCVVVFPSSRDFLISLMKFVSVKIKLFFYSSCRRASRHVVHTSTVVPGTSWGKVFERIWTVQGIGTRTRQWNASGTPVARQWHASGAIATKESLMVRDFKPWSYYTLIWLILCFYMFLLSWPRLVPRNVTAKSRFATLPVCFGLSIGMISLGDALVCRIFISICQSHLHGPILFEYAGTMVIWW